MQTRRFKVFDLQGGLVLAGILWLAGTAVWQFNSYELVHAFKVEGLPEGKLIEASDGFLPSHGGASGVGTVFRVDSSGGVQTIHNCSSNLPLYCLGSSVTRGQMAVFLVKTFSLP